MWLRRVSTVIAALVLSTGDLGAGHAQALPSPADMPPDVLETLTPDPVNLARQERHASGTGFFVSKDGYLVTALHVVRDRSFVMLKGVDDARWRRAKVIKTDTEKDLALLQVMPAGAASIPLDLGNSPSMPVGLEAYVIGFPLPKVQGATLKITQGIVNGFGGKPRGPQIFQLSAEVHKGSSGAPVLAPDGKVIGIVQRKLDAVHVARQFGDFPQNVNFALRSSEIDDFLKGSPVEYRVENVDLQKIKRPFRVFQDAMSSVVMIVAFNRPSAPSDPTSQP
jgi:S1-C subfamily serine protease